MSIIKLQQKFEGLTDQVLRFDSNGVLQAVDVQLGGIQAQIVVTTTTGATVTCSNEGTTLTAIENNGTWEFNLPNLGVWTVNGSLNTYTDSVQVDVTELKQYNNISLNLSTPISNVLDENDWATIQAVAQAGTGSSYWNVGDKKALVYSTNPTMYVFIIGFDHNKDIESNSLSTITFQIGKQYSSIQEDYLDSVLSDEYYEEDTPNSISSSAYYCMNGTGVGRNSGWVDSSMRLNHLNNDSGVGIFASGGALFEVYNYILPITKYTDNVIDSDGSDSNTSATIEKSFLLSPVELLGKSLFQPGGAYAGVESSKEIEMQEQYSYYLNHTPVKYIVSQNVTDRANYWTRSKRFTHNYTTCYYLMTGTNPTPINMNDHYSYGIAPAFVIG